MPDTNLTITNFDHGPMIRVQAEWWSTKDVIIAAHGSGVMNSVFITPKTIVLQIYPRMQLWAMVFVFVRLLRWCLINAVGGSHTLTLLLPFPL